MIITKLNGGLGNQFFQYAAGKALADFHKVELKLDLNAFSNQTLRKYELDQFSITALAASSEEINSFTFEKNPIYARYLKKLLQKISAMKFTAIYSVISP